MSIYETSVKKPISTILIFIGFVVFGLYSFSRLAVDLFPEFESNQLTVVTSYPGASAEDIEKNITEILEDGLNTVDKLKDIKSTSKENFSIVSLEFDWGSDLDIATNDVRDKLELVKSQLPDNISTPTIFKFSSSMIPIMRIVVTADKSLPALYKILEDQVSNTINRIDGVGSVSISGAPKRQIQVNVDPRKIEAYHLSINNIAQVIGANNANTPGGNFDIGTETYALRIQGEFKASDELKELVVGSVAGRVIYLKDIATIEDTVEDKLQEVFTDGIQGATISVVKQSGSNTVEICNKIREALPEIQASLPPDVKLEILIDNSSNILNSVAGLSQTIIYAFLFVMLVVLFFLGRWRATFIIILTIPCSLLVSFIYLMVADETLNVITLSSLSIAIGMVVDDAIVVLENITSHIERGSPPKQAAIYATNEVGVAVIATTLTVLAVFFPLTMVGGMAGIMFKPLGWMVSIVIVFSTIAALTLTPTLSAQMLRLQKSQGKAFDKIYRPIEKALNKLDSGYEKTLLWSLMHKKWVLLTAIVIFISSIGLVSKIGTEFFPAQDSGICGSQIYLKNGTRVEGSKEFSKKLAEKWKAQFPELLHISYTVGVPDDTNIFATLGTNGNEIITVMMRFVDPGERERGLLELMDVMRQDLEQYTEIDKFDVYMGMGKNMGFGGANYVDVEIYGYDFNVTNTLAKELQQKIQANVPSAKDVLISRQDFRPEFNIEFDRIKLAQNGIQLAAASAAARNAINGTVATKYREDGDEYDVKVRYDETHRQSIEDIENIMLYNAQGQGVKVSDVGRVVESFGPPTIERKNRERIIKVSATVDGTSALSEMVAGIQEQLNTIDIPNEIGIKFGGSAKDQAESFSDIFLLFGLVVLLVYIVMAAQFESFVSPFIIMLALPFAFTGVFLSLYLTDVKLGLTALIGAVMLVGIVVKNGIVLVDYINLQRERGQSVYKAVVTSGKSRLRPVLMTTLTTILGLIPMAIDTSQGSEMWKPMGIAVVGGLTFSTILTLIVVPIGYAIAYTIFAPKKKKEEEHRRRMVEAQEESVEF